MPTEVDDIDIEDVEDALLRAEELAVITGRKKTDIVADLLDDGKLNLSAGSDAEVKKDILDIAQEKAEKFKTLITTLIPVLALLLGIGAEGLGVLDVTGWGSDSMWEDDDPNNPNNYWHDDECYPAWGYDEYGYVEENNLEVRYAFQDYNTCGIEHFGGHFIITLFESGNQADQEFIRNIDFVDYINIEYTFSDLEEGTYSYRVEFHVVECEDGSCEHGDEYYMPANNQYIIAAYLYWAGSGTGDFEVNLNTIPIVPERTFTYSLDTNRVFFAAFAEVTEWVQIKETAPIR